MSFDPLRGHPAHQAGDRVVAQWLDKDDLSTVPQYAMDLAQRTRELKVMQNGNPEHKVKTAIGEFEAVRVHSAAGIGNWFGFYNEERQHQSLGYRTPQQAYVAECPWICGRSASPTGGASPTSRASSKSRQVLAFTHIPTGTAANRRIDQKAFEGRLTSASTAIGADIEIGRATP